jgi:hypothetical protein
MYFTPRLAISTLNRFPEQMSAEPCGFRYRVKVQNTSRHYGVADLELHARLVIRGLDSARPDVQSSIQVPVGEGDPFPTLDRRTKRGAMSDFERIYTLRIHDMKGPLMRRLPEEVRAALECRTVTLEQLLELGSDAFVRLAVTCSHSRSGYRRTYSLKFRIGDVAEGTFQKRGVGVVTGQQVPPEDSVDSDS